MALNMEVIETWFRRKEVSLFLVGCHTPVDKHTQVHLSYMCIVCYMYACELCSHVYVCSTMLLTALNNNWMELLGMKALLIRM